MMRVSRQSLPELEIVRLVAQASDPGAGIYEGETIAYLCERCGNADETLIQILHDPGCEYVGEHGRTRYPSGLESGRDVHTGELNPDHPIAIIRNGEHNRHAGVHQGEPIAFRCVECGNSDETLSEIVHDECCALAGRHGNARLEGVRRGEPV